ncbi:MAG: type I methionyl aminopeptidase [bacterium]|nr:type I methionyl aminopeptidase [bacterium]
MISIKTPEEIKIMTEGGKRLAKIMRQLGKKVRPGVATIELETLAERLVLESGGKPSFKGYQGDDLDKPYPACLCISVNKELVHAVPLERVLKAGDIVSLDIGMQRGGFHTDMARTFAVGKITSTAKKLMAVTKKALEIGVKQIKPGNRIGDISFAIQQYVEKNNLNVVRELCGHGIGRELHEDPQIMNFGEKGKGEILKEGMVICIEPMVTIGHWRLKQSADGFGYETKDGSLSCHFEDTIVVTKRGHSTLTKR